MVLNSVRPCKTNMSIKSALKTISLIVTASSEESESVRKAAINALARPPFVPSAPTAKKLWSKEETDAFYQSNPVFAEKIKVEHGEATHYEVVWADGKPMTKVSDNILLK